MSHVKLATAGESIKLWDATSYTLNHEYNPQTPVVSDLSWSYDGQYLASASSNGDKLMVALINLDYFNICEVSSKPDQNCLCFSRNTTRHLISGGKNGEVNLWDLKLHHVKKSYQGHVSPVTKVQFNWNDTTILSGSSRGDIIIHNVMTGLASSPLRPPKIQAIRDLKYSFKKRSLFAAASDDGVINLWDANSRNMIHSFKEAHNAPAMALAFSPVNEMLLTSVGLDKKIICFDVKSKAAVKTLVSDQPFMCLDFYHDGVTLAVGSTRGKIYIYDLRQSTTPVRTFAAHRNSVHSLCFQTMKHNSNLTAKGSGSANTNRSASLSPKRLLGTHPVASASSLATSVSQIPQLANKPTIKRCLEFNGKNNNESLLNQTPPDFFRHRNLSDDIFSPLHSDSSYDRSASIRKQPIGAGNHFGDRPITAGLDDRETTHVLNSSFTETILRPLSPPPAPRRRSASFSPRTSRYLNQDQSKDSSISSIGSTSVPNDHNIVVNILDNNMSSASKLPVRQAAQKEHAEDASPLLPDCLMPVEGASLPEVGALQDKSIKDDLRRLIEESVEDLQELINKKYQQLRIDLIKEFQIQKSEIETMLQRYAIHEDLASENERLREENRRLQSKF